MVDTYLPGAVQAGKVSTIDFSSVSHSDGCHADLVIYLPVRTYFCTDLYFVEEGRDRWGQCMAGGQLPWCCTWPEHRHALGQRHRPTSFPDACEQPAPRR